MDAPTVSLLLQVLSTTYQMTVNPASSASVQAQANACVDECLSQLLVTLKASPARWTVGPGQIVMPWPEDTSGAKVPPIRRAQCPQCRAMAMQDAQWCPNCNYLLRGGPQRPLPAHHLSEEEWT